MYFRRPIWRGIDELCKSLVDFMCQLDEVIVKKKNYEYGIDLIFVRDTFRTVRVSDDSFFFFFLHPNLIFVLED